MINVEYNIFSPCPYKALWVEKVAGVVNKREKMVRGVVEINVVDKKTIKKINREWRGKNQVTDVLSFAWQEEFFVHDYGHIVDANGGIVLRDRSQKVRLEQRKGKLARRFGLQPWEIEAFNTYESDLRAEVYRTSIAQRSRRPADFGEHYYRAWLDKFSASKI